MSNTPITINGIENNCRIESRILEERLQQAVQEGHRAIEVVAHGQHGIGGRLWKAGDDPIHITVSGFSGQRLGSMGFPGTRIDVLGPVSDDVGWLNAGAYIVVHGHATNGAGNAMAQGKIYIAGDIGARGMTMTKYNPRYDPPELWVLGSVGDSFAEFMAGGNAVICGYDTPRANILGYRPCVGMVGGKIFFRGNHEGFSESDARLVSPSDEEWSWLKENIAHFLQAIGRSDLYVHLTEKKQAWSILVARKPHEKADTVSLSMKSFCDEIWNRELGKGGLIGDLTSEDRSPIEVIPSGDLRRFVPFWENEKFLPPCQAHCPTGIPVQKRWELIRKGRMEDAVSMALQYTPFPATVCGYLCPNLCMQNCSRQSVNLPPLDLPLLGRASLQAQNPQPAPPTGKRIAVIGGGAAGLSIAWQLWINGHEPVIHESRERLGGKITETIPSNRIPDDIVEHELKRISDHIKHVNLSAPLTEKDFRNLEDSFDFVVIASGAQRPRMIPVPGNERAIAALDFLRQSKKNEAKVGEKVVIIGAGNVGCDAAAEAARLGAKDITLIDIQEPASYGKERQHAEAAGARFYWPRFTKAITDKGVELTDGELLPADTVIVAVGDQPDISFLPKDIAVEKSFVCVNEKYQTSNPRVFAIGDVVRLGLLTEAIGAGRVAARTIDDILRGREDTYDNLPSIDKRRVHLEYYDPREKAAGDLNVCSIQCASCGSCRDCGLCESLCPRNAISRKSLDNDNYEYVVDNSLCIGCGFCAAACPCGIWEIRENSPLE